MINFKNMKTISSLIIGTLLVISCEKSDFETENDLNAVEQVEDFISSEDNLSEATTSNVTSPVLTMHFDPDLGEEEAILKFDKAVDNYLSDLPKAKANGFSTEWFTKIYIYTGSQTDNGTEGDVATSLWFDTSVGTHRTYVNLEYENGYNDRAQGRIAAYLVRSSIDGTAVETVGITHSFLYLNGNDDDWFVTKYNAYILDKYQSIDTSGGASYFQAEPNVWLDNDSTTDPLSFFYTGSIGSGTLNF